MALGPRELNVPFYTHLITLEIFFESALIRLKTVALAKKICMAYRVPESLMSRCNHIRGTETLFLFCTQTPFEL